MVAPLKYKPLSLVMNHVTLPVQWILSVKVVIAFADDEGSRVPNGSVYEVDAITQDVAPKQTPTRARVVMTIQKAMMAAFSFTLFRLSGHRSEKKAYGHACNACTAINNNVMANYGRMVIVTVSV